MKNLTEGCTLSPEQVTMHAVESVKTLLSEYNGHPRMVLLAVALTVPAELHSDANLFAIVKNVETRL